MKCKRENFTCIFISTPLVSGLFILAALGLCCCMQPFSGCGEGGYSSFAMRGLLTVVASFVVEHGLSCAVAREIFLDQRSNSRPCIGRQILNHWATREVFRILR